MILWSNASKRCKQNGKLCIIPWSDCSCEVTVVWPGLDLYMSSRPWSDCSLSLILVCKHCLPRPLWSENLGWLPRTVLNVELIYFSDQEMPVSNLHRHCVVNPLMFSQEEFQEVHFVPDHVFGDDGMYTLTWILMRWLGTLKVRRKKQTK